MTTPTSITPNELTDLLICRINALPDNVRISLWNNYAEKKEYYDDRVETFDLNSIGAGFGTDYDKFARTLLANDLKLIELNAPYCRFDGNGNIKVYYGLSDENSPFSARDLSEAMTDSLTANAEYLDSYDKDDENIICLKNSDKTVYLCTEDNSDIKTAFGSAFNDSNAIEQLLSNDFFVDLQDDYDDFVAQKIKQQQQNSYKL